ncbi:hypothetical protein P154DRAFT_110388 [Amniculicola lignicola CBS 123094]|uniref:Myb-like domain-containing protein n=1 Tax=Amniculicola lignicola CBS 123094 TaxID=1392246 RepID=A0A6A5WQA8_9PLEO|nr:hypothetical protein P154DRAFT_110388 [Amniculicola lignicola CBS 123094]
MEPVRDAPWAEHEKVYLLAEIMKAAPIPSHVLFGILRDSNIQPKWNDIALPNGRSVRSCQMAYNNMTASYSTPDYRQPPQLPAPIVYPGPDLSKKRAHQPDPTPTGGRLLQPRPPHAYSGEFVSGPTYAISPVGEPANKKKRGRPTKAEAQARADAALARGEVYPPPRKARASITASEPPFIEARQPGETPPGTTSAQPMTSMTPQHTQPERGTESSSGKKKRGKPPALELEKPQRGPHEMGSPLVYGPGLGLQSRSEAYSSFTPISAPLPSATDPRERPDVRMEGVEETQPRTTTPHSFKDTVGI